MPRDHGTVTELRDRPMVFAQKVVVAICTVIMCVDGFDVLAISYVASDLVKAWNIGPAQLGVLFSSALVGMAGGSFFLAPLADRWGRRPMLLFGLGLITCGMIASAHARGVPDLLVFRLITGLGIGSLVPNVNTIVAEVASDRAKGLALSIVITGFPIGAVLGGGLSIYLLAVFDWRAVFWLGGITSTLATILVLAFVPESLDFLFKKYPRGSSKIDRVLKLFRLPSGHTIPEKIKEGVDQFKDTRFWVKTVLMCTAFFCSQFTFYFVANWLPKMLADAGIGRSEAINGSMSMSLGAALGGLLSGIAYRARLVPDIVVGYMTTTFVLLSMLPFLFSSPLLLPYLFIIGAIFFAGSVGLYTISVSIYSVDNRVLGGGIAVGSARIGAMLGPVSAGFLISAGSSSGVLFVILSLPLLIGAIALLPFRPGFRNGTPQEMRGL